MNRKICLLILAVLLLQASAAGQFLKISDNQRFLVNSEGAPFFWLGDTGWEMLHRLDRQEMEHYMRDRAGKGFTDKERLY